MFCGTGSLGLEALSRGAKWVTFVDKNPKVTVILERNIEKAGFVAESKIITAGVLKIGAPVGILGQKYNLVFVDPPYTMTRDVGVGSSVAGLLELLCGQLAEEAIVTVRTHQRTQLLDEYSRLKVIDRRQWGTTAVTLLQMINEEKRNKEFFEEVV